jgi:hypothetical protein
MILARLRAPMQDAVTIASTPLLAHLPTLWDANGQAARDAFDQQQMVNATCACAGAADLLAGTAFYDAATYAATNCSGAHCCLATFRLRLLHPAQAPGPQDEAAAQHPAGTSTQSDAHVPSVLRAQALAGSPGGSSRWCARVPQPRAAAWPCRHHQCGPAGV